MRKALLMAGGLIALSASVASATVGVDLAWVQCRGQTGATVARTSVCTATTGNAGAMWASVNPPTGILQLEGAEIYVDYRESGGLLSCWWNFASGSTRSGALTVNPVSARDASTGDPLTRCGPNPLTQDPDGYYFTLRGASGGGGGTVTGTDTGQLKGIVAIQAGTGGPVSADVQNLACGFVIANAGTGAGCTGCANGVTLTCTRIVLTQPGQPNVEVTGPALGNSITWQGGFTSVKNKSWGAVKNLYRN